MTQHGSQDIWLMVDGYELTGYGMSLNDNKEMMTEETHTFGDADVENSWVNLRSFMLDFNGFYDDAAGASDLALLLVTGASRTFLYGVEGTTVGANVTGVLTVEGKYSRNASRGAFHKVAGSFKGTGQVDECKLQRYGAFNGVSGDGTAIDNGASSANGGIGFQEVTATNGNFVGKIRHSTDNSTYADLITFATVTSGNIAGERKTVAGTVNRYTRSNWANSGSTGNGAQAFRRL